MPNGSQQFLLCLCAIASAIIAYGSYDLNSELAEVQSQMASIQDKQFRLQAERMKKLEKIENRPCLVFDRFAHYLASNVKPTFEETEPRLRNVGT